MWQEYQPCRKGCGTNTLLMIRRSDVWMRCPYCDDRRTEVLKTVYRGHNSYRHRRCVYCGSRFGTQERPVPWSRVERKWPGPCPSRKGWRICAATSLVCFASAVRMTTAAIDFRAFFHRFALGAAVFARPRYAGTRSVRTFL
jgi:hypothetical protein